MFSRRSFLQRTGVALCASVGGPVLVPSVAGAAAAEPSAKGPGFRLGMAGYSFVKFDLEKTLKMLQTLDVRYLCIKDFHLPLKSTEAEIAAFHEKCRAAGVTGYGVGPIYMGSEEEATRAFEYARRVGVNLVVGVPFKMVDKKRVSSPELVRFIEKLVREYDINYAIHNHGPDMPELFPSAESAMEIIVDLDPRIGLCLDIGHQLRDGKDPIQALKKYSNRVHDIHLKNVTSSGKQGRYIELPRGAIDIVRFVKALRRVKYSGVCSLEHEKDMENPLAGMAESIGYFRGVVEATA